jgi:CD2 antigen cytoplasmic tail-binding protein 2
VAHLDVGETLLEALQRLGVLAGKNRKRVKKAHGLASSQNDTSSSTEKEAAKTIERLTLLASKLMARLPWDLYGLERESLLRAYQRETGSALSIPSKATISQNRDIEPTEWEFRYAGTEEVHGPYSKDDLLAWLEEGRFVEHACEARQVGDTSFSSLSEDLLA